MSFRTRRHGCLVLLAAVISAVLTAPSAAAQTSAADLVTKAPADSDARRQAYLDLTTTFRLLAIVPQPGDEDLATLALCRRGRGVRTRIHYVTAGEQGNPGADAPRGPALGVRRIRESQRVAHSVGASVTRSWLPDAGRAEEGNGDEPNWSKPEFLETLVRTIREFRPHVVTLPGRPSGPGSVESAAAHTRVLEVALEAVKAAADRAQFDDHLQELLYPWQVSRVYVACAAGEANVALAVGDLDPHLGVTYSALGARARAIYTMGAVAVRTPSTRTYYRLCWPQLPTTDGPPKKSDEKAGDKSDEKLAESFFRGLVAYDKRELQLTSDDDYRRVREVEDRIIRTGFKLLELGKSDTGGVDLLVKTYHGLYKLNTRPYLKRRLEVDEFIDEIGYQHFLRTRGPDLNQALRQIIRVGFVAEAEAAPVAAGETFQISAKLTLEGDAKLTNATMRIERGKSGAATYVEQSNRLLCKDEPILAYFKVRVAEDAEATWPAVEAFERRRSSVRMSCVIEGRYKDHHLGFVLPIEVPPVARPVQIHPTPSQVEVDLAGAGTSVRIEFRTQGPLHALGGRPSAESGKAMIFKLTAKAPAGVVVTPAEMEIRNRRSGHPTYHDFDIKQAPGHADPVSGSIHFEAQRMKSGEPVGPVYVGRVVMNPAGSPVRRTQKPR